MSAATVTCPSCEAGNEPSARFCSSCGTSLAITCAACGASGTGRFCSQCGQPLDPAGTVAPAPAGVPRAPVAERRVTSVLFADLVGFTPLSESRDSEDVRELLSRYFAVARTVVERYGGTVEKFIGDAVMAVWGVPTAREDDAERAVRAGLDLVDAVAALGDEVGAPVLAMRVGIVTGEVAVTLGATGEGMVAGDSVNTAARVQSAASPNQVWVDATTRGLTSAAVAYVDAGTHELKGKSEPMPLFAARQVVATVGGAQRVDGLEAPFVGRDREMRLVKELFHATLEEGRPRLVAVSGLPGVGKSRLGWEFFKHIDGISDVVRWHRGRCLSYGEGVAFWALAEIVRSRLGVLEGDEPAAVAAKLDEGLLQWVHDPEERSWLAPRLAALLGVGVGGSSAAGSGFAREDLFASWQLFLERLVDEEAAGVALLIEDLQWADDGLLDFLDHLLERSNVAVFVLTLSRPELAERRPGWASGRRATPIYLEPLPANSMGALVDGLVDGLSDELRGALVDRSEGIPLYAVETIRSLIDRDAVVPRDGRYVLADGAQPDLDQTAPTSLHTLLAARLDTLPPAERRAVQDAAVLGMAFTRAALVALSTAAGGPQDLDAALSSLVRKEILTLESDPRSPERGQYRFVQAMVRSVAYETLSRRDRKARHLLAAEHLATEPDADSFAAVVASHYLDARLAGPDDADADALTVRAVGLLEVAAARARSLGAPAQALRHYLQALDHATDDAVVGRLALGAADSAVVAGELTQAETLAGTAHDAYERANQPIEAARGLAVLGQALNGTGGGRDLPPRLIPVYDALPDNSETIEVRARLAQNIARAYFASIVDPAAAVLWADRATMLAEAAEDWPLLCETLGGYGAILMTTGRPTMGLGLLRVALDLAADHGLLSAQLIPLNNLGSFLAVRDVTAAREYVDRGLQLAQRLGDRDTGAYLVGTAASVYWLSGAWEELAVLDLDLGRSAGGMDHVSSSYRALVSLARGESPAGPPVTADVKTAPQIHAAIGVHEGCSRWSRHDVDGAVAAVLDAVETYHPFGGFDDDFPSYWALLLDFAVESGHTAEAHRWFDVVNGAPRGQLSPLLRALVLYFRARLGISDDRNLVDGDYAAATNALREFGAPYWLGRSLLAHAEFLTGPEPSEAVTRMLDEAEQIFSSLRAAPWVDRTRRARALAVR